MTIGVDTGGTKTLIATFDEDGKISASQTFATPKDTSQYISQVAQTIAELVSDHQIDGICIAVPGRVHNQIAVICKNLGWQNFDVLAALRPHFPEVPLWLENDTNLGGVGATSFLDPLPTRSLYITISTGVNGCFLIDGQIEPHLAESELGEMVIEYSGQTTTWEHLIDGRAIIETFGKYADEITDPGDILELARRISRGLLILLPLLRPDIVTIGGGTGKSYDKFAEATKNELEKALPSHYLCPIITAPHPKEIVAHGCYVYAKSQLAG